MKPKVITPTAPTIKCSSILFATCPLQPWSSEVKISQTSHKVNFIPGSNNTERMVQLFTHECILLCIQHLLQINKSTMEVHYPLARKLCQAPDIIIRDALLIKALTIWRDLTEVKRCRDEGTNDFISHC